MQWQNKTPYHTIRRFSLNKNTFCRKIADCKLVFVFFWNTITDALAWRRQRSRHQTSHQTIQFKSAVRQQKKKEAERGYRHKCAVCGKTDTSHPDLEFRYCSKCEGNYEYCQDHLFTHTHVVK